MFDFRRMELIERTKEANTFVVTIVVKTVSAKFFEDIVIRLVN